MSRLPLISGAEAVKAFARDGWTVVRQHGSHVMMTKAGQDAVLAIPLHAELKRGTLRALLRAAGIEVEDFVTLL